jgi:MoaA/NifB/PqqE/SkfB family radical SAM enzyme
MATAEQKFMKGEKIQLKNIKDVIENIRNNFNRFILTGGELFTIPYWKESLSYLKDKKLPVWLITNAALLEPSDIPFLGNHVEGIIVPFPSPNKKMYRQIMGADAGGLFDKVVNNLKLLGTSRIQAGILFSSLRTNYRTFYDTVKYLKEVGIRLSHVFLNRIIPTQHTQTYFEKEKPLTYFEHKVLIEQLVRIRRELHIEATAEAYPESFLKTFIENENKVRQINQPFFPGSQAVEYNADGNLELCLGITSGGDNDISDFLDIDDEVEFKDGIDNTFMDLLISLYKPFLTSSYKKAMYRYTVLSKHKYKHPVGFIAVDRTTAIAHFIEIALVPGLAEKYYSFLVLQKLFRTLPIEKYGWTADKANYPSISLLEKLGGGFYPETVKNKKRIKAEGFFRIDRPVSKNIRAALEQLKPQSKEKFQEWLDIYDTRKKEKQALHQYLEEYTP